VENTSSDVYFQPRRLGHVNLWVSDIDKSERFYNEVCGLTVEFTEPGLVATFLGTGHTPHDLGMIEKTDGKPRYGRDGLLQLPPGIGLAAGLNHLAWELENEAALVRAFKALKSRSIATDMTVDHQVAHSVYMSDPDKNVVEFYCDTVRDWRKVLRGTMDLITSEWDPLTAEGFTEGRYETNPEIRIVDKAPVHPQRITHAVLESANVPRLVEFYTSVGGLRVVDVLLGGDVVLLGAALSTYRFSLVICKGHTAGYHHAAFELSGESALDSAESAVTAAGIPIAARTDLPWKRSFFLKDPDGMLSEYYVSRSAPRSLDATQSPLAPAYLV
jgi:catechol 2,3-dioxygenase